MMMEAVAMPARQPIKELAANRALYGLMPDNTPIDYNRIFDAIDAAFGTSKVRFAYAERFMCQYRDAMRNFELIDNRYQFITAPRQCDESRFRRDPTTRLDEEEDNRVEASRLNPILHEAEMDCARALKDVGGMICRLQDERQRMVMTAHYLCFVDWKIISRVYGRQDRWAKDVHVKAMAVIDRLLADDEPVGDPADIEDMIRRWKTDEFEWKIWERKRRELIREKDDLRVLLALEPNLPERQCRI